jgi:hypothetical protein
LKTDIFIKTISNLITVITWCALLAANAEATVTNVEWVFPASTSPGPSQPIAADLAIYSTNNFLGWTAAGPHLNEVFVANPGKTTALEFSYNGNQSASLNGFTLTLSSTISGLAISSSLTGVQLSYDTKWSNTGSPVTETWAYSLNGGAFLNFQTNTVTGSAWQTINFSFSGLQLENGDTLNLRATLSGAAGIGQSLGFDNIQIISKDITPVPEPSPLILAAAGVSFVGIRCVLRLRPIKNR